MSAIKSIPDLPGSNKIPIITWQQLHLGDDIECFRKRRHAMDFQALNRRIWRIGLGNHGFFKAVFCRVIKPRVAIGNRPDFSAQANFAKKERIMRNHLIPETGNNPDNNSQIGTGFRRFNADRRSAKQQLVSHPAEPLSCSAGWVGDD